jgi:hypothetical protein
MKIFSFAKKVQMGNAGQEKISFTRIDYIGSWIYCQDNREEARHQSDRTGRRLRGLAIMHYLYSAVKGLGVVRKGVSETS